MSSLYRLLIPAVTGLLMTASLSGLCGEQRFDDIVNQKLSGGTGTLEFRFKLNKDISKDPHNHVLMLAVSSDLKEFHKIEIVEKKLIVWRDFGGCLRTAFACDYDFKVGEWHVLRLSWNKATTKFFVDNKDVPRLGLFSTQDSSNAVPEIRLGHEENFVIAGFTATPGSTVQIDPADQEFVAKSKCPRLRELVAEAPQEQVGGVAYRHFPDQAARDKAKSYMALLPAGFAGSVKNVIYVEDERFPKGGEAGLADSTSGSIFLKGSYFSDPTVFFHEAAHLYDFKLAINFGVPNDKSEWAAISGRSCYYSGADMAEFAKNFEKTKSKNAFLNPQGGQCPSEDLAIWVGAAYDYYLKNKTFAEMMDPSNARYSDKTMRKLEFLLGKGFLSRELFSKITAK